jgi:hypothetical protein
MHKNAPSDIERHGPSGSCIDLTKKQTYRSFARCPPPKQLFTAAGAKG